VAAGATSRVATLRVAASPAGPFLKEDSIATLACLVGYSVTASPTVTHTPTATTIAIDARGSMGEADVGLTHCSNCSRRYPYLALSTPLLARQIYDRSL
jgi:hypothetical protein